MACVYGDGTAVRLMGLGEASMTASDGRVLGQGAAETRQGSSLAWPDNRNKSRETWVRETGGESWRQEGATSDHQLSWKRLRGELKGRNS